MSGKAKQLFALGYRLLALLLVAPFATAQDESSQTVLNMPVGVTPVSHQIHSLHMTIFWICVVIGVVVFGVMFWAMYFHRKSRGHQPSQFHEHLGAEITWTVIPFFILIAMAFPATKTLKEIYEWNSGVELDIKVTGWQWKWQYEYLGEGVGYMSELATSQDQIFNLEEKNQFYLQEVSQPLVIPARTKVRFQLTAKDVIHSWWVPDFGVKKDAIPGYVTETWAYVEEPGIYRGECTELCGQGHAFMPVVVQVLEPEEFQVWMEEKKAEAAAIAALKEKTFTMEELMTLGADVYARTCAVCHGATGEGIPGAFPAMVGSPIAKGPIEAHLEIVVHGKTGTAMQAFSGQLNEADLAAVITYERNAFGNNTGDIIQPIDVYNYAQGL